MGGRELGVGYIVGCLFSILFWKIDRQKIFFIINNKLKSIIPMKVIIEVLYLAFIVILYFFFDLITYNSEVINALVAFVILDISNSERHNLGLKDKIKFYESLSIMTKSLLCGFIAPLVLIIIFDSNYVGLIYFIIYNLRELEEYWIFNRVFALITLIPSMVLQVLYYIIYIFRNKKFNIDFKGDYFRNLLKDPILNLEIMGAYIESINFYYYFTFNDARYIKSYGSYNNRIDEACIRDYLSISYGIAFIFFMIFITINFLK